MLSDRNRWLLLRRGFVQTISVQNRFQGTIIEKWINYWKSVKNDYTEVVVGVVKSSIKKPIRTFGYLTLGGGLYACYLKNPDEQFFLERFNSAKNELILVAPELRNRMATEYLKRLQLNLNQNRQRFLSFGIFTIMWEDLYDKDDCTYPAQCEYTKVNFWNFHKQIIDIGFWNCFWRLQWNLRNYDVNYL